MSVSVPTTMTSEELANWLHRRAGARVTGVLGWTVPDAYADIIGDALIAAGESSVEAARDLPRLLAHARIALWQAVIEQTSGETYLAMPDGIRAYGYQINEQAHRSLAAARRAAAMLGIGNTVTRQSVGGKRKKRQRW